MQSKNSLNEKSLADNYFSWKSAYVENISSEIDNLFYYTVLSYKVPSQGEVYSVLAYTVQDISWKGVCEQNVAYNYFC
jgi:hypothetical protein